LKISIIAVGKIKDKYIKEGIAEYSKRLSRFCDLEIIEVEDEQAPDNISDAQVIQIKKKEAEKLRKKIREGAYVIALDLNGDKVDSKGFARKLKGCFVSGVSHIVFLIGGSLGFDEGLLKETKWRLSMSDMTFPHQLARFILLEQLFRCFKINNGETYHK